jgi:hypothetical protein
VGINQAQASGLINAGLQFADDDTVTLNATTAAGTHLNTSLKDLQKLGVDAVAVAGAEAGQDLSVELGTGALSATGLPTFASGLDVTLNLDSTQVGELTLPGMAGALATAGIDELNINVLDGQAGTAGAGFANELNTILNGD